jgi:uncharacterized protein YjiS (DUF1127 family)
MRKTKAIAMPMRIIREKFRPWGERRQRRAAVRELRALDDRTLKDMGLTRGEIRAVVDGRVHGERGRRRERKRPSRCTPEAAPVETIDPATLQGHLARARKVRAEYLTGLLRRGLGGLARLLRRAETASDTIEETAP